MLSDVVCILDGVFLFLTNAGRRVQTAQLAGQTGTLLSQHKGVIHKVRTHGGRGVSRPMRTHCVHGEGGGGGVRAAAYVHIFFNIQQMYLYLINIILNSIFALRNHLQALYYTFYISMKTTYVRTGGWGGGSRPMRTHCVQGGGRGGQKMANFCVRTLWMAPNYFMFLFLFIYVIFAYSHTNRPFTISQNNTSWGALNILQRSLMTY